MDVDDADAAWVAVAADTGVYPIAVGLDRGGLGRAGLLDLVASPRELSQVDEAVGAVGGDGAYDKQKVFDALATPTSGPPIRPIIALRKDAIIQQHGNCKATPLARDEILRAIRRTGRKGWKQASGYHRRSLAETLIYRYKHLIGGQLKARSEVNQQVESRLGCAFLNRMSHLGKPQSYRIEKSN